MPWIENSKYKAYGFLSQNPHVSTIYMAKLKQFRSPNYQRIKLELNDGDFLNLDFQKKDEKKALILCHGLEGDSRRTYMNTCAEYFLSKDYSVFAWNYRTCGGEMNRLARMYHHGTVDDLDEVVKHVIAEGFEEIYLMGFSMGGALTLNYLGQIKNDKRIKAAVAVSAPISLQSSSDKLKIGFNQVYLKNFTYKISKKLKTKAKQFPDLIDRSKIKLIKTFDEVDGLFTAPLHGYKDREEYYQKASPINILDKIEIPTLIINAWDDPFLGDECYPVEFAQNSKNIFLETPQKGGHCAFPLPKTKTSWAEMRAYEFFNPEMTSKGF